MHIVARWVFQIAKFGRCPCCGKWSFFSSGIPAAVEVPAEMQALVPRISKCSNGCTSSVGAITRLELRKESRVR